MSRHAPELMVNGGQMTGGSVLCHGIAERRAIVPGAGSGIGRACATLLARHGAAVAVADLREDTASAAR
jgi:3-hydroxybutyrate dehydrogenase